MGEIGLPEGPERQPLPHNSLEAYIVVMDCLDWMASKKSSAAQAIPSKPSSSTQSAISFPAQSDTPSPSDAPESQDQKVWDCIRSPEMADASDVYRKCLRRVHEASKNGSR
jgi:hypothetical protein